MTLRWKALDPQHTMGALRIRLQRQAAPLDRIPHTARVIGAFVLLFILVTIGAFVFMLVTGSAVMIVS